MSLGTNLFCLSVSGHWQSWIFPITRYQTFLVSKHLMVRNTNWANSIYKVTVFCLSITSVDVWRLLLTLDDSSSHRLMHRIRVVIRKVMMKYIVYSKCCIALYIIWRLDVDRRVVANILSQLQFFLKIMGLCVNRFQLQNSSYKLRNERNINEFQPDIVKMLINRH